MSHCHSGLIPFTQFANPDVAEAQRVVVILQFDENLRRMRSTILRERPPGHLPSDAVSNAGEFVMVLNHPAVAAALAGAFGWRGSGKLDMQLEVSPLALSADALLTSGFHVAILDYPRSVLTPSGLPFGKVLAVKKHLGV